MNKIALTPLAAALTAVAAAALAEPVVVTTPYYLEKDNAEPSSVHIESGLLNDWFPVEGGWTSANITLASVSSDLTVTSKDNLLTIRNPERDYNTYSEAVRIWDGKMTINSSLDVDISNTKEQVLGIRSNNATLSVNGDTKIYVNAESAEDKQTRVVSGAESNLNSSIVFNGKSTEIHAYSNSLNKANADYVYAVDVRGGSTAYFNSTESVILKAEEYSGVQNTYTAFGLLVDDVGNKGQQGGAYFDSKSVDISASSNARSQGVTVYNTNELVFNRGDITITAETSGDNQLYSVGIHEDGNGAFIHVKDDVENFRINVVGAGTGSINPSEIQSSSVGAYVSSSAEMIVDADQFDINVKDQSEAGEEGGLGLTVMSLGEVTINSRETHIAVSTE